VLDQGQIAASGTHEELRATSELYNQILGSQLLAEPVVVGADDGTERIVMEGAEQ
jgi:hypothetical protein